jgi:hypothetical protein
MGGHVRHSGAVDFIVSSEPLESKSVVVVPSWIYALADDDVYLQPRSFSPTVQKQVKTRPPRATDRTLLLVEMPHSHPFSQAPEVLCKDRPKSYGVDSLTPRPKRVKDVVGIEDLEKELAPRSTLHKLEEILDEAVKLSQEEEEEKLFGRHTEMELRRPPPILEIPRRKSLKEELELFSQVGESQSEKIVYNIEYGRAPVAPVKETMGDDPLLHLFDQTQHSP